MLDRIAAVLGRRHALSDADIEEFGSWVKERLIEREYAVYRQFAGRSSLGTYLAVVVANLFRDFRNSRWGRWRPSAAATRLGPLAVRLETLLHRDGHSFRDAVERLKGHETEPALRALAAQLPRRMPQKEVGLEAAVGVAAPQDPSSDTIDAERVIADAMAELPVEDRVIVRMHYWDDFSVADIARTLGLEQRRLYRRLESIQVTLGRALAKRGLDRARIAELLAGENR
jgi:RNA polymerase sigma factor for flagellar operon FliA